MPQLMHMTAQYSNAVLIAILPFVSDFAQKLQLPILTPLTPPMVQSFAADTRKGAIGGVVTITNGYQFWFDHGFVTSYESPRSYFHLQDPDQVPKFFGPVKLSEAQAVATARKGLTNLGYNPKDLYADIAPNVTTPPQVGSTNVPRYRLQWADPVDLGNAVDAELNATDGSLEMLTLQSRKLWREAPKVVASAPEYTVTNLQSVSATESNALVRFMLPQVSEWARQLKLPVRLPVTTNSLERLIIKDPTWDVRMDLTNGYSFLYSQGYVRGFHTPDVFWRREPHSAANPEHFFGQWNLSEDDAVTLVRNAVEKISGEPEAVMVKGKPTVLTSEKVGSYKVPRYWIEWLREHSQSVGTEMEIVAEVDADKKVIKYLRVFNGRVWRKVPDGV
jgi:hypothetical protein